MNNVNFENTELKDIIELRNVSQTYNNGKSFVIEDFNLLIENKPKHGQFVVLLGPSGCGKSTILRYITSLQKPSSGEIFLYGKPLEERPPIGMVFQQYSSFPWMTVLENVMLPLKLQNVNDKEAKEKAMYWIDRIELSGHEHKHAVYPKLSGGQLQRVAIARSLITNPEILLLDEPFGALDRNTRYKMQQTLASIWESLDETCEYRNTIIMVTHDISEAVFLGDDIYIMSKAPSKITEKYHVNLPFNRNKEIKRSQEFFESVKEVEDLLDKAMEQ